jgi:hypothetical protein
VEQKSYIRDKDSGLVVERDQHMLSSLVQGMSGEKIGNSQLDCYPSSLCTSSSKNVATSKYRQYMADPVRRRINGALGSKRGQ